MMNLLSLEELSAQGKKVAFVAGNRKLVKKNVDSKVKSFKEFGCNLVPLIYVEGTKAVQDGCTLMNPHTLENIPDENASQYITIVDGQHRCIAALQAEIPADKILLCECQSTEDTRKLLAAMNYETTAWTGKDFASGALLMHQNDEFLQAVSFFTEKDFNLSSVSKFLFFKGGMLTKANLSQMYAGEVKPGEGLDIERGRKIYEAAAKQFDDKFLSKRYFIDAVIEVATKIGTDNYIKIVDAIQKLNKQVVKQILETKADMKTKEIKRVLESTIA